MLRYDGIGIPGRAPGRGGDEAMWLVGTLLVIAQLNGQPASRATRPGDDLPQKVKDRPAPPERMIPDPAHEIRVGDKLEIFLEPGRGYRFEDLGPGDLAPAVERSLRSALAKGLKKADNQALLDLHNTQKLRLLPSGRKVEVVVRHTYLKPPMIEVKLLGDNLDGEQLVVPERYLAKMIRDPEPDRRSAASWVERLKKRPTQKIAAIQDRWMKRTIAELCEEYGLTPEELADNVRIYQPKAPVPVPPKP